MRQLSVFLGITTMLLAVPMGYTTLVGKDLERHAQATAHGTMSDRTTRLEKGQETLNEDVGEIKEDLKEIRRGQEETQRGISEIYRAVVPSGGRPSR
jgi:TolA-binding protein